MNRDVDPSVNEGYAFARNVVYNKQKGYPSNEDGFSRLYDTLPILGRIVTPVETILFVATATESKIIRHKHRGDIFTNVINDPLLAFKYANPIEGVYEYNQKGQLVIAWWEGLGPTANAPRVLNLDCMPFALNGTQGFINASDVDLLLLSPNFSNVDLTYSLITGNLPSGSVQVGLAYVFPDNTRTSYFLLDNPLKIYKYDETEQFHQIVGNAGGINSGKGLRIGVSGTLNNSFYGIKVGLIYSNNGVVTAYESPIITIPVDTIVITSLDEYTPAVLEEILAPPISFRKVQTGATLDSKLYVSNYETNKAPDLQRYVNNIKVKWTATKAASMSEFETSYKNPIFSFKGKAFKPNEVAAFYLLVTMKTGEKYAYHIPGRAPKSLVGFPGFTETSLVSAIVAGGGTPYGHANVLSIAPNAKYFQFYDTADVNGDMGYWENENETYPNNACMQILNSAGEVVGALSNQKVRHHKFPSTSWLHANSVPYVVQSGAAGNTLFTLTHNGWSNNYRTFTVGGFTETDAGAFSLNNRRFTASRTKYLMIAAPLQNISGEYRLKWTYNGELKEVIRSSDPGTLNTHFLVTLNKGDYLELGWYSPSNTGTGNPIVVTDFNIEDITIESQVLGVDLEDIYIPPAIRSNIAYMELGYAERDSNNSLVMAEGLIHSWRDGAPNTDPTNLVHSFAFDLLHFKPDLTNVYLSMQLALTGTQLYNFAGTLQMTNLAHKITNWSYVPESYPRAPTFDEEQFSHVAMTMALNYPFTLPDVEHPILVDFVKYRTDVYFNRLFQKVVTTGIRFAPTVTTVNDIYGGDTYKSLYAYHRAYMGFYDFPYWQVGKGRDFYMHPVSSIADIGLRSYEPKNFYPPKQLAIDEDFIHEEIGLQASNPNFQKDNGKAYNNDFHMIHNKVFPILVNCADASCSAVTGVYKTRTHQSLSNRTESTAIGWRVFLANAYYDNDRDAGEIWCLRVLGRSLLIHHVDGLFELSVRDKLQSTNFDIVLGRADLFEYEVRPVVTAEGGYLGCQSKWASVVIPYGYVFYDARDAKFYLYNVDQPVRELSDEGMYSFFRDNSAFPEVEPDNPFCGSGFCIGYDDRMQRILFTKVLRNSKVTGGVVESGWTLSFALQAEAMGWAAEHDYLPSAYIMTRENIWAVRNNMAVDAPAVNYGSLYRMNNRNIKGLFFEGLRYSTYIEFVINTAPGSTKRLKDVRWKSVVKSPSNYTEFPERTFTSIAVYNRDKSTGIVTIVTNSALPVNANTHRKGAAWVFNHLSNIASSQPILSSVHGALSTFASRVWYANGNIEGDYFVVRLYYNNLDNNDIILLSVGGEMLIQPFGSHKNVLP